MQDFGDYFSSNIVLGTPLVKYVVIIDTDLTITSVSLDKSIKL